MRNFTGGISSKRKYAEAQRSRRDVSKLERELINYFS
jgi:hypothetical protein